MGNLTTAKAITFLDIETTHLDPKQSAILSISIVTDWDDGTQDVWTTKIKPKDIELHYASPEAIKVCNYSDEDWKDAPNFNKVADTIIKKLCDDFLGTQWEYRSLIRLKANLYPQTNVLRIHGKHQDFSYKHTAAILYINSNDGYTEFEDGRCIESIENRLLVFDGSLMHNSTNCTNRKARINLSLNYF